LISSLETFARTAKKRPRQKEADDADRRFDIIIEGGRGDDILTGNDGADVFTFRDNQTGDDTIADFDPSEDVVELVGFGGSFDPLAALSATTRGTELDLGGDNSVLLLGRTVAEFRADDFLIV
jgi:Ca2+-binding RTX toxin-like protein